MLSEKDIEDPASAIETDTITVDNEHDGVEAGLNW